MSCRLILFDGLPGSGKSTSSVWLADQLAGQGAVLLREREPNHPLNVGGELHPSGDEPNVELFVHYDVDRFLEESLSRWHAFVPIALASGQAYILDSYPFQNSTRVLFQMDAPLETIDRHFAEVEEIARPLLPRIIFFEQPDVDAQIRGIAQHRGAAWTEMAVEIVTGCPYARARNLTGLEGALVLMCDYSALMDRLLARSKLPILRLTGCYGNWQRCYEEILSFMTR